MRGALSEGKLEFVKNNVPGRDDFARKEIEAPISLVLERETEKDAWGGSGGEFVWCSGGGARVTQASEDAKTIIGWRRTEEKLVWGEVPARTTRSNVN